MISTFFDKKVEVDREKRALVVVCSIDGRIVRVDLDADHGPGRISYLTPEQAKALGRALIKAGKFVEKGAKK